MAAGFLRSTEDYQRPADRCLLIATGNPPFWCFPRKRAIVVLLLCAELLDNRGLRGVFLRENAGSHLQVAISRQPVVFSW